MHTRKLKVDDDVIALDRLDKGNINKNNIMPLSYAGRTPCMTQNYHDALSVSHVRASPDIFTTFTCNPKWPQITERLEPGQTKVDRADVTNRVYRIKLLEYLQKIISGKIFGAVETVFHNMEFQKNGLPHARILVWQKKNHDQVVIPAFINSFVSTTGFELANVHADAPVTALSNAMETALDQPSRPKKDDGTAVRTISSKALEW